LLDISNTDNIDEGLSNFFELVSSSKNCNIQNLYLSDLQNYLCLHYFNKYIKSGDVDNIEISKCIINLSDLPLLFSYIKENFILNRFCLEIINFTTEKTIFEFVKNMNSIGMIIELPGFAIKTEFTDSDRVKIIFTRNK